VAIAPAGARVLLRVAKSCGAFAQGDNGYGHSVSREYSFPRKDTRNLGLSTSGKTPISGSRLAYIGKQLHLIGDADGLSTRVDPSLARTDET